MLAACFLINTEFHVEVNLESVLKLAKGSLCNTFLHLFHTTLYYYQILYIFVSLYYMESLNAVQIISKELI